MERGFPQPREWDQWVASHESNHFLQSSSWAELKARFGWQPIRIAVLDGSRIVAGGQILLRSLLAKAITTAYLPKGPLVDLSAQKAEVSDSLWTAIHGACRASHALALKVEPDWPDSPTAESAMSRLGFTPSPHTVQPRRTVVINLELPEEGILGQMKPKTRYNIRLAERKGITVALGDASDLPTFYQLMCMTGRRDGFAIHSADYYDQAWQLFDCQEQAALLLAHYEHRALATVMVFAQGKRAWYMYGASSDEERQRMPTYLLQWEAMRWAKARGCQSYDLWGIPDVSADDISDVAWSEERGVLSTGMGGLYRFKRGFGGSEIRYVGAYDYVYNRPLYLLMNSLWQRRKHRALG